jgi:hypothetical protein
LSSHRDHRRDRPPGHPARHHDRQHGRGEHQYVGGLTGPPIVAAINPSHRGGQNLADAVRAVADAEPAAQAVRRELAAAGIAATVFACRRTSGGSWSTRAATTRLSEPGIDGDKVGTVRYALIVTDRLAGEPRLDAQGSLDLSTVHLR